MSFGLNSSIPVERRTDVFIAGSGPIGATYAKLLIDAGYTVTMVETGTAESFSRTATSDGTTITIPGAHKKNNPKYQKDINSFVPVVKGDLEAASTSKDLEGAAVTRSVGGMSSHWTCATPRMDYALGRPRLDFNRATDDAEWAALYPKAEGLIGTTTDAFDGSARHQHVLKTLQNAYAAQGRKFEPLPLACTLSENKESIEWHAADRILRDIYANPEKKARFTLLTGKQCTRFVLEGEGEGDKRIAGAEVRDLANSSDSYICARAYVVAAGTVANPQILFNSGFDAMMPNLGRYITERTLAFCQVTLTPEMLSKIPLHDLEPQVTTKGTFTHPWHTLIHREAFHYGAVADDVDPRLVVDLRFLGHSEPRAENAITFDKDMKDAYGMPRANFTFRLSDEDERRNELMMADMTTMASKLGELLPGSEPKIMPAGTALHLAGSTRMGLEPESSVVNPDLKAWDFENLYIGGNSVLEGNFAANPTLTSMALAMKSANAIALGLRVVV